MNKKGEKVLSGDNAFKCFTIRMDSRFDLTREILEEKNLGIDEDRLQRSDETPERAGESGEKDD